MSGILAREKWNVCLCGRRIGELKVDNRKRGIKKDVRYQE